MSFNRKRQLKNTNPFDLSYGKGSVVRVLTGRTRQKLMVVTEVFTDKNSKGYALVADGKKYTVNTPKKKSVSHLEFIKSSDATTDEEIVKLLENQ